MSRNKNAFPWADSGKHQPGMTLFEWYAGLALQGLLASDSTNGKEWSDIADDAYMAADALIARIHGR